MRSTVIVGGGRSPSSFCKKMKNSPDSAINFPVRVNRWAIAFWLGLLLVNIVLIVRHGWHSLEQLPISQIFVCLAALSYFSRPLIRDEGIRRFVIPMSLVLALVGGGFFLVLRPWQRTNSWMTGCGTHISRNHQDAIEFRERLDTWFSENNFVPSDVPSDSHSWAGGHQEGDKHFWYVGSYEGFEPVYLHMRSNERRDVGGGWTDFHFYTSWFVRGSDSHLNEAKAASDRLASKFAVFAAQGSAHTE
ncbi:MAG: hypothetical protein J0M04_16665 [Verrucomicrobia bacterium]|nr:hypothetical protein [Verrucomicrobiota bacterium]